MASFTLNLSGQPSVKIPTKLQDKEPTFVLRYWMVAEIVRQLAQGDVRNKKIIDVGGNGSLLPDMLNKKIDILDLPDNSYENYIQASALDMPIKDNEYDIAVTCDVYEHIPEKDRVKFIDELLRVSKEYVVICGPMYKKESADAEKRVNQFFKDLTGRDHPWLEEHIDYTLPKEQLLLKQLKEKGYNHVQFDHGSLAAWELITKLSLIPIDRGVAEDNEIIDAISKLNKLYIKELGLKDFAGNGYRTIYIIQKQGQKPLSLTLPKPTDEVLPSVVRGAAPIIERLVLGLHGKLVELEHTKEIAEGQSERNDVLAAELSGIHASHSWQFAQIMGKVARPAIRIIRKTHLNRPLMKMLRLSRRVAGKTPLIRQAIAFAHFESQRQRTQRERKSEYNLWFQENKPRTAELEEQKERIQKFSVAPTISIVVPTYNTDEQFLRDCINSVITQTYQHWELCIADDASTDQKVRDVIVEFSQKDPRIKYVFRETNGHISAASNSALEIATGDYIALLDHDDVLWPNALYEVVQTINQNPSVDFVYTDEDKIDEKGQVHSDPFFKPAWSPDYLRSINYITHFAVIRSSLVKKVGGFRVGLEGAQDWDLFLRVTQLTNKVVHVPKIVYSWRRSEGSTAMRPSAKNYAYKNQRQALIDDAKARGLKIKSVKWAIPYLTWKSEYELQSKPKISIIIPTKDKYDYIRKCLSSIKTKTTYDNIEIIVVDTGSQEARVWDLYDTYKKKFRDFKVVKWTKPFNFSSVCNYGAAKASGEYLLFLNNDTEVITKDWIESLLQYAQLPHVGAVGCKLLYPTNHLQHAGVVLGVGGSGDTPGVAAHLFPNYNDQHVTDFAQNLYVGGVRNFSAVTAACIMVSADKFKKVKGFNDAFQIAWNDVDFCLKLVKAGWFNVYTPFAKLYHHESISVGHPGSESRDLGVFKKEIELFGRTWGWDYIANDPYYSPHFRKDIANARLKPIK